MTHRVALVLGQDEAPLARLTAEIVEAAGVDVAWTEPDAPEYAGDGWSPAEWDTVIQNVNDHGVALVGALSLARKSTQRSPHVVLRERCQCFAGIRPVRRLQGMRSRVQHLDLVVIRETTEDVYAGHEHEVMRGGVTTLKVVTEAAVERIARFAFDYAQRNGRKKVSIVHKANIMKLTDGLFLKTARRVANDFPDIACDDLIVDNASMQMVLRPERYDVLLTGNMYGDILSALAAGLAGGDVALHGIGISERTTLFESLAHRYSARTAHSNPLSLVLPAVSLLRHLGEGAAADAIWTAVETVLQEGRSLTPCMGGEASARQMTDAILAALGA
jgi:isocitrate dehydrogenase (NAD+)